MPWPDSRANGIPTAIAEALDLLGDRAIRRKIIALVVVSHGLRQTEMTTAM
jgi:hypothetical protein